MSIKIEWVSSSEALEEEELPPRVPPPPRVLSPEEQLAEDCMAALERADKLKTPLQRHESHISQAAFYLHGDDAPQIRECRDHHRATEFECLVHYPLEKPESPKPARTIYERYSKDSKLCYSIQEFEELDVSDIHRRGMSRGLKSKHQIGYKNIKFD